MTLVEIQKPPLAANSVILLHQDDNIAVARLALPDGHAIVVDAQRGDAFTAEPANLWRHILGRQPGSLGWMRLYPDDVEVN